MRKIEIYTKILIRIIAIVLILSALLCLRGFPEISTAAWSAASEAGYEFNGVYYADTDTVTAEEEDRENEAVINIESIEYADELSEAAAAVEAKLPEINAASAIVIDMNSGRVLFEKNAYTRRPMASTTKIMTGVIALEYGKPDELVTVSQRAVAIRGSNVGLQKGREYRLGDLIYGLLMESGNDASIAIAEHIGGTVDGFLRLMNEKAMQLGARDTHFVTPHGLDAEGHYSTASDMAVIARYALQNPAFSEIVGTRVTVIDGKHYENTNEMLGNYEGADGVKTGYTGKAGRCLVTSATRGELRLISVVLNCGSKSLRALSSRKILDYAFSNYRLQELLKGGTFVASIPVIKGMKSTAAVRVAESFSIPVSDKDMKAVEIRYRLAKDIPAPVYAGVDVGTAQIFTGEEYLGEVKLKVWEDVKRKGLFDSFGEILNRWFKLTREGITIDGS